MKERSVPPPWVPTAHFQHTCFEFVECLVPGLPYSPSTDPNPQFLHTSENLAAAAGKVSDIPIPEAETRAFKGVQPTRAQLIIQDVLNKMQHSTKLFNSRRPVQSSLAKALPMLNPTSPTNAQRIIHYVFNNLQIGTHLFNSHRQSPPSLLVRPPNLRQPSTEIFGGVGRDGPSLTRAQSIIRHVFRELENQYSVVIASVSPQQPSVDIHPGSISSSPTPHSRTILTPILGLGVDALVRAKRWVMRGRYSPHYIPNHRRLLDFLEDE